MLLLFSRCSYYFLSLEWTNQIYVNMTHCKKIYLLIATQALKYKQNYILSKLKAASNWIVYILMLVV